MCNKTDNTRARLTWSFFLSVLKDSQRLKKTSMEDRKMFWPFNSNFNHYVIDIITGKNYRNFTNLKLGFFPDLEILVKKCSFLCNNIWKLLSYCRFCVGGFMQRRIWRVAKKKKNSCFLLLGLRVWKSLFYK